MFDIDGATTRLRLAWMQKQRELTPAMLVADSKRAWAARLSGVEPREQALITRYMARQWVDAHQPLTIASARLIMRAARRHGLVLTLRDEHDWELVQARELAATRHFKSLPVAMPGDVAATVMIKFDAVTLLQERSGLHRVHAGTLYASLQQLVISDGTRPVSFAWAAISQVAFVTYGFRFNHAGSTYVLWTSDRFGLNATLANFLTRKVKHATYERDSRYRDARNT